MEMTKDLGLSISKVQDQSKQRMLLGAVIKLTDIAKGNLDLVDGSSLEETLTNQLSLFTRNTLSQQPFSQETNKENNGAMLRAVPPGNQPRNRQRSRNERIMNGLKNSNKRPEMCSLCLMAGHRAGPRCAVLVGFGAAFIASKSSKDFAYDTWK